MPPDESSPVNIGNDDQAARDRAALESILGRSLENEPWPADAFAPGTRVRVVQDPSFPGPWQRVFTGAVDTTIPPLLVQNPRAAPGEREYSVRFDEPQIDADGDGPYRKAIIWDRYLEQI